MGIEINNRTKNKINLKKMKMETLYRKISVKTKPEEKGWYNIIGTCHPSACGRSYFNGDSFQNPNPGIDLKAMALDGIELFWLEEIPAQENSGDSGRFINKYIPAYVELEAEAVDAIVSMLNNYAQMKVAEERKKIIEQNNTLQHQCEQLISADNKFEFAEWICEHGFILSTKGDGVSYWMNIMPSESHKPELSTEQLYQKFLSRDKESKS